ncbi:hypothetical protein FACS189421_13760 [Bacteroidia bacterium]|nr:hypothetical protein FACS189421_13760 [Bacteroidia bacterium]GHT04931.1 hypothetical protein FACS189423_08370 [Bacteroidia bacterium]
MTQSTAIKLFETKQIRTHWEEESEAWYFSVVDVVEVLTESSNPRDYWFRMKQRVTLEDGIELSTICRQLKMLAPDGFIPNAKASKKGGAVAKNARKELESKTGKSVITDENFLPPAKAKKELKEQSKKNQ